MTADPQTWDVIVIGAGPAGLFAARALSGKLSVLVLEEKARTGGAGAMTDGKLNLSPHIGLDLSELQLSEEEASERIARIDEVFLEHGADRTLYGVDAERIALWLDRVSWVRRRTHRGEWDITLLPARQRHMGTDLAHQVVARMTEAVAGNGATFSLRTKVDDIHQRGNGPFIVRTAKGQYLSRYLVAAPGREGAYWFREVARSLGVPTQYGAIDIGCRVEVALPVYDEITQVLYDPKFLFVTPTHGDRTRTFCTNPGGRVRVEIRNGSRLVNGDALKKRKTPNTNFAILNTVSMTEPIQDTTEMGRKVMEFANFWGGGDSLVVQRWGDLTEGRRSKAETFHSAALGYDKMPPTLPPGPGVTPGDISFAYPGRIVDNLRESLLLLSRVIPGVAHPSTTIYVPEIKFYDTKYRTDRHLETNVPNLFVAGDGVGKSRGIVGAALNGMLAAEGILRKEGKG
ncbi:MAG: FAD-dependent oxidoreductase [Deltaproteobacteria bacterium]|nr:FAD-dependent oxidoreductase [Deltaproteobacteria bacterium]